MLARLALLAALLTGCIVETFTDGEAGVVYECRSATDVREWCSVLDADELGEATGRECERTSRLWPRLTNALSNGCAWSCPPPVSGCNALDSCWCEP